MGMGDLDVVAEDGVVADLERGDTSAAALLLLVLCQPVFAGVEQVA
jgi:hypothetical protein